MGRERDNQKNSWRYTLSAALVAASALAGASAFDDQLQLQLGTEFQQPEEQLRPFTFEMGIQKKLSHSFYLPARLSHKSTELNGFGENQLQGDLGLGYRFELTQAWDLTAELGLWWRQYRMEPNYGSSYRHNRNGGWLSLGSRYYHASGWEAGFDAVLHVANEYRTEFNASGSFAYPLSPKWAATAEISYEQRNSKYGAYSVGTAAGVRYKFGR